MTRPNPSQSRAYRQLIACTLALGAIAPAFAATHTWSGTTSGTFNWAAGTSWSSTPVSDLDTILAYTSTFTAGRVIVSNNDVGSPPFKLNALSFTNGGPATGTAPTLTLSGSQLEFITNSSSAAPTLTFNTTGTVKPTINIQNNLLLTNNLTIAATTNGTLSGVISGTGGITKTTGVTASTLTLSGLNTYDAPTTIATAGVTTTLSVNSINSVAALTGSALGQPTTAANGQINIGRNGALVYTGAAASSDRNFNLVTSSGNATITNSGSGLLALSGTISGSAANLVLRGAQNITAIGQLSLGAANLLKVDAGTVTLSNASNAFSGFVHVQGGAVSVNSIAAGGIASALGTGTQIQLGNTTAGGTLVYTGTGDTTDRVLTLAGTTGGGTLDQSGTGLLKFTSDSTVTGSGAKTLVLQGSTTGTGEFAGKIIDSAGGATSVTKSGTGTWTLSGANTHQGPVTVNGGTLILSGVNTYNAPTTIANAATTTVLNVNSINSIGAGGGSALGQPTTAANGQINIGRNGLFSYTGGTASSDRNFNLTGVTGNAAIGNSGGAGSNLTLSGTISGSAGTLVLRGTQNLTVTGQVTLGAAGLRKVESGTVTLSGSNTFTGTTTVDANSGTLLINGNHSLATGDVSVGTGSTLGGTGIVGGATTVNGNLAPGAGVGVLTFNSSLNLGVDSVTTFEVGNGARGTGYDGITVGGAFAQNGTLSFNIAAPLANTSYNLIDFGSRSGAFTNIGLTGAGYGTQSLLNSVGDLWSVLIGDQNFEYDAASGILDVSSAIPEPSTFALLSGLGVLALAGGRRRATRP